MPFLIKVVINANRSMKIFDFALCITVFSASMINFVFKNSIGFWRIAFYWHANRFGRGKRAKRAKFENSNMLLNYIVLVVKA